MSASPLKIIYYIFFHLAMSHEIILWGNSSYSSTIFSIQKRQLELRKGVGKELHIETYLRNKKKFVFDITMSIIFINASISVEIGMKINPSKSMANRFTRTRTKVPLNCYLLGMLQPEVNGYKCLGIIIRSDLSWADQVNYTVKK